MNKIYEKIEISDTMIKDGSIDKKIKLAVNNL